MKLSGLFLPIIEVVVATIALTATLWWYTKDQANEAFAGMFITGGGLCSAVCHLLYEVFRDKVTHAEAEERYKQRKRLFQEARSQIANEDNHLQKMLEDPSTVAGKAYAERHAFESIVRRVRLLEVYRGYNRLSRRIVNECERILNMPSGQKDVSRLVPMLRKLDKKLAHWLHEPVE